MILGDYLETARDGWASFQRLAGFLAPAVPVPPLVQPLASVGLLLALALTTGIALASLGLLLTSLLFLYLVVTQVFGIEVRIEV